MARIAENVHRRVLPETERAELIAEWVRLLKERKKKGKDKPRQVGGVSGAEAGGRGRKGGIGQAARDLGMPASNVRRAVRIASLSDAAKAEAKALGLDNNQSALLKAALDRKMEKAGSLPGLVASLCLYIRGQRKRVLANMTAACG